jgi:serine/threonine protein kinase
MPRHKIIATVSRGRTTDILQGIIVHPEGLGSQIAIKRLHEEFASDEPTVRAFLNEARVGVALHHANVVDVLRASSADGQPEIIMQYLLGWSLDSISATMRVQKKPVDFETAVTICHAIASGAAHMHELGLVHRHITPGNIMVTTGGCAKLIDFGGAIRGPKKPASRYTAPEFFLEKKPLDARGDVYAIGAILYELTTGRVLFDVPGSPVEQIIRGNYEPASMGRSDYPGLLETIVKRCMSHDLEARYQSADALLEALEHFSSDRRYTLSSRVVRSFCQKNLEPPTQLKADEKPPAPETAPETVPESAPETVPESVPETVTRIHFTRRVVPPPIPPPAPATVPEMLAPPTLRDIELTPIDIAIG